MSNTNSMATLLGGVEFTAVKRDGTSETVFIKQLNAREYLRYLEVQDEEPKAVEMVCGKPDGWSNDLTPESFAALVTESEKVNAGFFPWLQRRADRQERINPGITEALINAHVSRMASSLPTLPQAQK